MDCMKHGILATVKYWVSKSGLGKNGCKEKLQQLVLTTLRERRDRGREERRESLKFFKILTRALAEDCKMFGMITNKYGKILSTNSNQCRAYEKIYSECQWVNKTVGSAGTNTQKIIKGYNTVSRTTK